jgi:hypothetical protein
MASILARLNKAAAAKVAASFVSRKLCARFSRNLAMSADNKGRAVMLEQAREFPCTSACRHHDRSWSDDARHKRSDANALIM